MSSKIIKVSVIDKEHNLIFERIQKKESNPSKYMKHNFLQGYEELDNMLINKMDDLSNYIDILIIKYNISEDDIKKINEKINLIRQDL